MAEKQSALFAAVAKRSAALAGATWSAAVQRCVPPPPTLPPPPPPTPPRPTVGEAVPLGVGEFTDTDDTEPVGVGEFKGTNEEPVQPPAELSHTTAGAQTNTGTPATPNPEDIPDEPGPQEGRSPHRFTGMEKMPLHEEDRRLGASIRGKSSHEGRVNAVTDVHGGNTDADVAPNDTPDEAVIVSDITRNTDDDHTASHTTADSNEWGGRSRDVCKRQGAASPPA
jgi:hypothetical protein